jgi:hypothetical protein
MAEHVPPPKSSSMGLREGPGIVSARPRLPTLHPQDRAARFHVADAFNAYLQQHGIANTDAARAMKVDEKEIRKMRIGLRAIPFHKLAGFQPHHEHALTVLLLAAARAGRAA